MKMIDKIKEYIEAQAFSTQDKAELEAFRIKFLGSKDFKRSFPSSRMS
jgi:phenylalanyl-tRNA synthetase alpha chain